MGLRLRWRYSAGALFSAILFAVTFATPSQSTTACQTSAPGSNAYSVTVCITTPAAGDTVTGVQSVVATVSISSQSNTNLPTARSMVAFLDGGYLETDFAAPFQFAIPSDQYIDGSHTLSLEIHLSDGFISGRPSEQVTFANGVSTVPAPGTSFTPSTTPLGDAPSGISVAAAGDGASGESNSTKVASLIAGWHPDQFLYLGDVYEKASVADFFNNYGGDGTSLFGQLRSITNPTIGNHEYFTPNANGYFRYWSGPGHYYSYDSGAWHFISLDSTSQYGQLGVSSAQYNWLAADLDASTSPCTLVYTHEPLFSVGAGSDTQPALSDIWALLAAHHVELVLTGHVHNYQRWQPLDATGSPNPNGVTEIIVGTGGHGIGKFVRSDARMVQGFDTAPNAYGALRLQLTDTGASYAFVNVAGATLDSGTLPCVQGISDDVTAPTVPTGLTASLTGSNGVALSWDPSTDDTGVTGYNVYRNGALRASAGTSTSYTDTPVPAGTTLNYTVTAHDAYGNESAQSEVVTVTTGDATLFSDGFETGNLSQWTSKSGLVVQSRVAFTGAYAAEGASSGATTYATKKLQTSQPSLYYRIRFNLLSVGSNDVGLMRFRGVDGAALMSLFRKSTGFLGLRNDFTGKTTLSSANVALHSWHELQLHLVMNGTNSQTEVWLDGTKIGALSITTPTSASALIGQLQLGNTSSGRTYDLVLDDILAATAFIDPSQ
jgi:Calcineurin-like phosphoesterase/Bacterial Ig domain